MLCCLLLFSLRLLFYAYALSVRTGSTVLLLRDHGVRLAGARGTCYLALSSYRHVMLRALSCRCRLIVPRRLSVCLGLDFVWCLSTVCAVLCCRRLWLSPNHCHSILNDISSLPIPFSVTPSKNFIRRQAIRWVCWGLIQDSVGRNSDSLSLYLLPTEAVGCHSLEGKTWH